MSRLLNSHALITADDWGMSPGINAGILTLAKKGLVRRVSCIAKGKYLAHRVQELTAIPGIELGLHFDLTFEKSRAENLRLVFNSFFSPSRIRTMVLREFREQWSKLKTAGINPTYLDGHHHIHLFPGVLNPLLEEVKFAGVVTIRTVCDALLLFSPKIPVVILSYVARPKINRSGLKTLACWYPKLERIGLVRFKNGLRALKNPTEVIVHPANKNDLADLHINDTYTDARLVEFTMFEQV